MHSCDDDPTGLLRRSRCSFVVGSPVQRRLRSAALVALALRGMGSAGYASVVERTVRRFVSDRSFLRQDLIEELKRRVAEGPVVVATASEVTVTRRLLDELGVRNVEVVGSELEETTRSLRFRLQRRGAEAGVPAPARAAAR